MPLIATETGYGELKRKIELARAMREQKHTYKEISHELCVSAPMAWEYVNNGEHLLSKYMPEPDETEKLKWEDIYQTIKKLEDRISENKLDLIMKMWARETKHPARFKRYLAKRSEEDEKDEIRCILAAKPKEENDPNAQ